MRGQFFLASIGAMAIAGSAFAADLPSRAPPPVYLPPEPVFTWTGFYIGGQIGYAWGHDSYDALYRGVIVPPPAPVVEVDRFLSLGNNPSGVICGGHIGYNLQINQYVVGLVGDVNGTSFAKNIEFEVNAERFRAGIEWPVEGSVRGLAGVAVGRFLLYVTGGIDIANFNTFYEGVDGRDSFSQTRAGWTVGAGAKYAVTNNWLFGVEYRYADFGRFRDRPIVAFDPGSFVDHNPKVHRVQAVVSYKFNPPFGLGF